MIFGDIIQFGDRILLCKRMIRISHNPIVDTWKEHLNCDVVLKKKEYYYFCQEIEEAKIIK